LKNLSFKVLVALALILSGNSALKAETVPSTSAFNIYMDVYDQNTNIIMDSNLNTNNHTICWSDGGVGRCNIYNSDDSNEQTALFYVNFFNGLSNDIEQVRLIDDNDLYVLFKDTKTITNPDFTQTITESASIAAYSNNTVLFPSITLVTPDPTQAWQSMSFAVTPNGFWFVGSHPAGSNRNVAYRYNRQGELLTGIDVSNEINPSGSSRNCGAFVSANNSGDIIISWIERNNPSETLCRGSVVARKFRESGVVSSDYIDVSNSRTAATAFNGNPTSKADASGEFILAWDKTPVLTNPNNSSSFITRVSPFGNASTIPTQELFQGGYPHIASGIFGNDFIIYSDMKRQEPSAPCPQITRLAIEGNLEPVVEFNTSDCNYDSKEMMLLPDGSILEVFKEQNIDIIKGKRYFKPAEISIDDVFITEGNSSGQGNFATVTASLSKPHPTDQDIHVNYFTRDITALNSSDYQVSSGTLTFQAGNTIQDILIPIVGDTDFELNESFSVNLELNENSVIKKNSATVTIINDDNPPPIENNCDIASNICQSIQEPDDGLISDLEIILSMNEAQSLDVIFTYETEDVTATAGIDYIGSSGTISIPAGSTQTSLVIPVLGDLIGESTETFKINFNSSSTVTIVQPVIEIAIINEVECQAVLSPLDNGDVILEGGSYSFDLDTMPGCDWTLEAQDNSWLHITSPLMGTGDATVSYTIDSNVGGVNALPRENRIDVKTTIPFDQTASFFIVQEGDLSLCPFEISGNPQTAFDVIGGSGSFNVTAPSVCVWGVTLDPIQNPWITVTSPTEPVFGNATVEYTVNSNAGAANVETALRTQNMVISLDPYVGITLNQTGCTFDLSETTVQIDESLTENIATNVLAPNSGSSPCEWTAVSTASWLLVTSGNAGSGGGEVVLEALENPSVQPRTGIVSIGGNEFSVTQSGQSCVYDIDNSEVIISADGEMSEINVIASAGCSWSLESNQTWLNFTNNSNGVGDETASVQTLRNSSETPRTAIISFISGTPDPGTQIDIPYTQPGYLVYEPFNGNSIPSDFITTPDGSWQVVNDQLTGQLLNVGMGIALEVTDRAYCSDCKVEGDIKMTSVSSLSEPNIGLVAWYNTFSDDYVSLSMDELANKWRLSLFKNGIETFVEVTDPKLVANQTYQLTISSDEQNIYAQVDGQTILQMQHNLIYPPTGYSGFMLNNANGVIDELYVDGITAKPEVIFRNGFEAP
jgi:hypothetical protein